jgi:hypothetical protein
MAWKLPFSAKLPDTILARIVPPFAARVFRVMEDVRAPGSESVIVLKLECVGCIINLKAVVHPGHMLRALQRKKKKKEKKTSMFCVLQYKFLT